MTLTTRLKRDTCTRTFIHAHTYRIVMHPAGYAVLLVAVVGVGVLNAVLFRKLLYSAAGEYVVALSILQNAGGVLILVPLQLTIEWLRRRRHNTTRPRPSINNQNDTPAWVFLTVATLDAMGVFFMLVGGSKISGALALLLAKGDIVVAMALTLTVFRGSLGAVYRFTHFTGAGIVLAGIAVVALPPLIAGGDQHNSAAGIVLYALSVLPLTASEVLKESASKRYHIDAIYLCSVMEPWQLLASCLSLPALLLPGASELSTVGELASNLLNGLRCVGAGTGASGCTRAFVLFLCYLVVNVGYNLIWVSAMRYGSAVATAICQGCIMPVAAIVFAMPAVMGAAHTVPMEWDMWVALVLVITGLGVYMVHKEHPPPVAVPASDEIPLSRLDGEIDDEQET